MVAWWSYEGVAVVCFFLYDVSAECGESPCGEEGGVVVVFADVGVGVDP